MTRDIDDSPSITWPVVGFFGPENTGFTGCECNLATANLNMATQYSRPAALSKEILWPRLAYRFADCFWLMITT